MDQNAARDRASLSELSRDLLIVGFFSLALFGYAWVGQRVLTLHEARLPQTSREMAANGDWLIPRSGGRPWLERPPLPHWLTVASLRLFGHQDQEWVYRIPPALAGVCCVLLTVLLARRWLDREISLLSGLMLATSFEFLRYAWMAEEDVFLAAAVLIGIWLFVKLEFDDPPVAESAHFLGNRSRLVWIFFLVLGLSNLVKGLFFAAVMVGLSGGTFLLWNRSLRRIQRYIWLWGWGVCLVTSCLWCWAVTREYPEMLKIWLGDVANRTDGNWSRVPIWYYGETLLWSLLPWTPAMLVGVWVTVRKGNRGWTSAERFLICWACMPLIFLSIPAHKHHHYLVPCLAPWSIFAAIGARTIWVSVPAWPNWLRRPATTGMLLGIMLAVGLGMFRNKIPGPGWVLGVVPIGVGIGVTLIGRSLISRTPAWALSGVFSVVGIAYCFGHSYSGAYVDTYREDTRFLRHVRESVPAGETIYVNADGAILNTFRNLFYLGDRGIVLHNLTFLKDQRIMNGTVYLVARRGAETELCDYGVPACLAESQQATGRRGDASRWSLFRLELRPDLEKIENGLRISALQAMEREPGPYLGRQ